MFDDLIKQLKKLETKGVSIPVQMDNEGYFDRECPNKECLFQFKVFEEDWKNLCKDEGIHCPLCGHEAPSASWWTKQQLESAQEQALGHVTAAIGRGLAAGAREFNRKQRPGLITMSMSVSGHSTHHTLIPIGAHDAMKLKIQCESCTTRYAVVGSAYFCPCCGFNSVERTFDDSLKKVEAKIDNIVLVRSALESAGDKDTAELTCRSLIETGINDCVVAFQKLMEALYLRLPKAPNATQNVFQRLDEGSSLWRTHSGEGYEDWLSATELAELKVLFHRRHLLAHTEGFVDERYLQKSGDSTYTLGQRIVVKEKDVRRLVDLIRRLTSKARAKLASITPVTE